MLLRIVHITLSLLMFISSTGAPLFRHYCMNRVKDVSLFTKAKSCQSEEEVCSIHFQQKQKLGFERKKCCQNRVDYLKISSDLADHFSTFPIFPNIIAVLPTLTSLEVSTKLTKLVRWQHYRPPPPSERAIHIWVQSFLC